MFSWMLIKSYHWLVQKYSDYARLYKYVREKANINAIHDSYINSKKPGNIDKMSYRQYKLFVFIGEKIQDILDIHMFYIILQSRQIHYWYTLILYFHFLRLSD